MKEAITLSWKRIAVGVALLSYMSACQTATEVADQPTSATSTDEVAATPPQKENQAPVAEAADDVVMLSGEEIREVLVGNTWYSEEGKEYHREDGMVRGRWQGGRDYTGKWSIDGDYMHFDYAGTAYDGTYRVGRATDGSILFYRGGTAEYRGNVLDGNPFGL